RPVAGSLKEHRLVQVLGPRWVDGHQRQVGGVLVTRRRVGHGPLGLGGGVGRKAARDVQLRAELGEQRAGGPRGSIDQPEVALRAGVAHRGSLRRRFLFARSGTRAARSPIIATAQLTRIPSGTSTPSSTRKRVPGLTPCIIASSLS